MERPHEFLAPEQMAAWDAGMRRKEAVREREYDPFACPDCGETVPVASDAPDDAEIECDNCGGLTAAWWYRQSL